MNDDKTQKNHMKALNRTPTFRYAAPPIDVQEVAVSTRADQSLSSLVFITEMVTASVLQLAGGVDGSCKNI